MGVKPYLIVAALRLVVAQRLVRLLCPHCKVRGEMSPDQAVQLKPEERNGFRDLYIPQGCAQCKGIGYFGRKAVIEVMPIASHEMRELVMAGVNPETVRQRAIAEGMRTLRESALELAAQGLTSLAEALTIYYAD